MTVGEENENSFPARVNLIEPLGSRTLIFLEAEGQEIRAAVQGVAQIDEGSNVHVNFDMERSFYFDDEGNRL